MKKNYKKFSTLFFSVSVILLVVLVVPVSLNHVKGASSDHGELSKYGEAAEEIVQIVNSNIVTLPKLKMVSSSVINNVLSKLNKYSVFVNDYSNNLGVDSSSDHGALFDDLISGYQASRKFIYLIKDIDNITSSAQTAYTLINTAETFLEEQGDQLSNYTYNGFDSDLRYFKTILDRNNLLAEDLVLETISRIRIDRNYYSQDIVKLLSLREDLKEIKDSHLDLSEDIIKEVEDVVRVIDSGASSDHGM